MLDVWMSPLSREMASRNLLPHLTSVGWVALDSGRLDPLNRDNLRPHHPPRLQARWQQCDTKLDFTETGRGRPKIQWMSRIQPRHRTRQLIPSVPMTCTREGTSSMRVMEPHSPMTLVQVFETAVAWSLPVTDSVRRTCKSDCKLLYRVDLCRRVSHGGLLFEI